MIINFDKTPKPIDIVLSGVYTQLEVAINGMNNSANPKDVSRFGVEAHQAICRIYEINIQLTRVDKKEEDN